MKFVVVILDMVLLALGFWFSVNYFLQEPIMLRLLGTIIWMITVMFVQQIICKLWLWEPFLAYANLQSRHDCRTCSWLLDNKFNDSG